MLTFSNYSMKINGTKENRDAFIKKMTDNEEPNYIEGFWSCEREDIDDYSLLKGNCLMSVEDCNRESDRSGEADMLAVNTADFSIELEIYFLETYNGFEKHFIYRNGKCIVSEHVDNKPYRWVRKEYEGFSYEFDPEGEYDFKWVPVIVEARTFEQFKKDNNLPEYVTEEDMVDCIVHPDRESYYIEGGFGKWEWSI